MRPLCLMAMAMLLVLIGTAPADAHRLKVFASGLADQITGYGYFTGGGRAAGAEAVLATLGGDIIARKTTDQEGRFQFTVTLRQDYQVTLDTGDGHIATFIISATELNDTLPMAATQTGREHPVPRPSTTVSAVSSIDQAALTGLIEQAVAKQITPLRAQLDAYEARYAYTIFWAALAGLSASSVLAPSGWGDGDDFCRDRGRFTQQRRLVKPTRSSLSDLRGRCRRPLHRRP